MTSPKTVEFFFDFLSPFAYLAHQKLPALAARYGFGIRYVPMDLPRAKRVAGNTGPSNREIPVKLRYLTADMNRWAVRYGVPLVFPKSFASEAMNKGTMFAEDRGRVGEYVAAAFARIWGRGEDMSSEPVLRGLALDMGWSPDEFLGFVASPQAAEWFEALNQEAHYRGVFGVPTMMVGEEMWWGNDRMEFLEDFLRCQRG